MAPSKTTPITKNQTVHFNLDTYERETTAKEPFVANIGGKPVTFVDPVELDYRELMGIDDPDAFADIAVPEDQREHFKAQPLKVWQLNGLMDAYQQHYGLGSRGNAGA